MFRKHTKVEKMISKVENISKMFSVKESMLTAK